MPLSPFGRRPATRTSRLKNQAAKSRTPQRRKMFFESLEDRRVMAFTPGDVFAASAGSPYPLYNVTGGGNQSGLAPFASLSAAAAGQIAWSADLETAYVSVYGNGTVVAVSST